jgi:2-C-methyl-D-erythritol 4-phosphate cytidylyltransferase/2-C-methyl-D-erythritol 2,4-cyclodiphosphate synthase
MTAPSAAVILVAAGSGTRLGRDEPKAFVEVAGVPILERAIAAIAALAEPLQLVVVAPADWLERAERIARAVPGTASVTVVAGGHTRQRSVAAGLDAVGDEIDVVLVHDAARVFTPVEQFARVLAEVRSSGDGVVPGLPVADTVKQVDWRGVVERTIDRSQLVAVQTPQGFPHGALAAAYDAATADHTDDAALFAANGNSVRAVDGDPLAFKITTPADLRRAESLAAEGTVGVMRTGIGIDVHAYDESSPLWLGGVYWPDEPGLAGHSDGDAISHAVCDALLSAAGLGDMGSRFGTSEPRFAAAHGDVFLDETVALVRGAGFTVLNVAVQVVGNRPKIATRRLELEAHLSGAVGAPVSVSATTSDSLGFTGRGEGVTAVATALIQGV